MHIDRFNVLKSKWVIRSMSFSRASNEEKKKRAKHEEIQREVNDWWSCFRKYDDRVCLFMMIMQKSCVILNQSRRVVERQDRINHDQFFDRVRHCRISKRMNSTTKRTQEYSFDNQIHESIITLNFFDSIDIEFLKNARVNFLDSTKLDREMMRKDEKMTSLNDRVLLWLRMKKHSKNINYNSTHEMIWKITKTHLLTNFIKENANMRNDLWSKIENRIWLNIMIKLSWKTMRQKYKNILRTKNRILVSHLLNREKIQQVFRSLFK